MQIAEVAEKYHLTQDTLRYYERIGLIPPVHRSRGGIRDYSADDVKWVGFMTCMRAAGLPIETLIEYVHLFQQGEKTKAARKALLVDQRDILAAKVDELQKTLDRLNKKIEHYDEGIAVKEDELSV